MIPEPYQTIINIIGIIFYSFLLLFFAFIWRLEAKEEREYRERCRKGENISTRPIDEPWDKNTYI